MFDYFNELSCLFGIVPIGFLLGSLIMVIGLGIQGCIYIFKKLI